MTIGDAVSQVNQFKEPLLADTVADIESRLHSVRSSDIPSICADFHVSPELLLAAAAVKHASTQIDVVIHAVGIICSLPHILEKAEIIEHVSLGAGSAGSDFDLVTDLQIAEFKFINWQGGSEAVRKKTLFQDYFKLVREETAKAKCLYLLNTVIPLRFLQGRSSVERLLDRNQRLLQDFRSRYGQSYRTVGEFYKAHGKSVQLVNLVDVVPGLDALVW